MLAYVEREKPDVVFLDFDRTLASTKTGGSPLQGADLACRDAISWETVPPVWDTEYPSVWGYRAVWDLTL